MKWVAASFLLIIIFGCASVVAEANLFLYSLQTTNITEGFVEPTKEQMEATRGMAQSAAEGSIFAWMVTPFFLLRGLWIVTALADATLFLPMFLIDIGIPAKIADLLAGCMWLIYGLGVAQILIRWKLEGG